MTWLKRMRTRSTASAQRPSPRVIAIIGLVSRMASYDRCEATVSGVNGRPETRRIPTETLITTGKLRFHRGHVRVEATGRRKKLEISRSSLRRAHETE